MQCDGCGAAATRLQCPLCEAEGATTRGFYCRQACFAQHWAVHRATHHARGVVRARKRADTHKTTEVEAVKDAAATAEAATDTTTASAANAEQRKRKRTQSSNDDGDTAATLSTTASTRRKQPRRDEHDEATTSATTARRGDDDDNNAAAQGTTTTATNALVYESWLPLPASLFGTSSSNSDDNDTHASHTTLTATSGILSCVSPPLAADCRRAVVAVGASSSSSSTSFADVCWPSVTAAAAYIALCQRAYHAGHYDDNNNNNNDNDNDNNTAVPPSFEVLVVAPDVSTAAAFAWAARCAGLTRNNNSDNSDAHDSNNHTSGAMHGYAMYMAVDEEHAPSSPRQLFAHTQEQQQHTATTTTGRARHTRIVVTTSAVVQQTLTRHDNDDDESAASHRWLRGGDMASLLLTLPGVAHADALQGVQQRAVFFVAAPPDTTTTTTTGDDAARDDNDDDEAAAALQWWRDDGATHTLRLPDVHNDTKVTIHDNNNNNSTATTMTALRALQQRRWQPLPLRMTVVGAQHSSDDDNDDNEADDAKTAAVVAQQRRRRAFARVSNEALTCLVNGDAAAARRCLLHGYTSQPGTYEAVLRNTLLCDWTSVHVAHAHHRLAAVLRHAHACTRRYHVASTRPSAPTATTTTPTVTTTTSSSSANASLLSCTLRAVMPLCRLLPPLTVDEDDNDNNNDDDDSDDDAEASALYARARASATASERRRYANFYSDAPTLQLQTTLSLLYDDVPPALLDALGAAWGVTHVLPGRRALAAADDVDAHARDAVVRRLRCRYGTRIDAYTARYLTALMHVLYDTVAVYSCSVRHLQRRLLWRLTLAHDVGDVRTFLAECELLSSSSSSSSTTSKQQQQKQGKSNNNNKGNATSARVTSLSSRLTAREMAARLSSSSSPAAVRAAALCSKRVRAPVQTSSNSNNNKTTKQTKAARHNNNSSSTAAAATTAHYAVLPWQPLPLCAQRQARLAQLRRQAVDEVLMAMPRAARPMYISDVGNLIGKWSAFNARFDGALGVSLSSFLLQHSDAFAVAGTLVTRRSSGTTEQIRVRYHDDAQPSRRGGGGGGDNNDNDGDDHDDGDERSARQRRARDRELLTGLQRRRGKAAAAGGGRGGTAARGKTAALAAVLDKLPARARKRRLRQAVNRARYNRNYKSTDASARVPGYVKHAPRRVKGRGRKANKRVTKRGA